MTVTRRGRLALTATTLVVALLVVLGLTRWGAQPTAGKASTTKPTGPAAVAPSARAADWVKRENAKTGTAAWQISSAREAGEHQLTGWADQVSVTPGASFGLHVSSTLGSFTVTAYRLGWYAGKGGREVWSSGPVKGSSQAPPKVNALRTVTTSWPTSTTISTKGWPEGTYLLKLAAKGKQHYVPVTVRATSTMNRLVILNAVTTYAAYNQWGGYSLYKGADGSFGTRAHAVSFDRPYDGNGAEQLMNFEQATIAFAEKQGLDLAYLTSWDLDHDPGALSGARGVVSLGHDEYWSPGMRSAVERGRLAGTNVAFLGGNAVYWRIRFADNGRTMVGYKSAALDPRKNSADTTAMWRQAPRARPENSLTGQLYECFPARGAMVITTPSFFLFRGTGVTKGQSLDGLVGTEIDRAYPIKGTPANLQVVAHSPVPCAQKGRTFADFGYYAAPSGAGVVDVGSMLWVRGMKGTDSKYGITRAGSAFAQVVTRNLFAAMAAGPMGRAHPPVPNLASLGASTSTSTGTGGPFQLP